MSKRGKPNARATKKKTGTARRPAARRVPRAKVKASGPAADRSIPGAARVTRFIAALPAGQKRIAGRLREVILSAAPKAEQTIKWGYPHFVLNHSACSLIPVSDRVNLEFFHGAFLQDPEGLLEGTGKALRHYKVSSLERLSVNGVRWLVQQSLSI